MVWAMEPQVDGRQQIGPRDRGHRGVVASARAHGLTPPLLTALLLLWAPAGGCRSVPTSPTEASAASVPPPSPQQRLLRLLPPTQELSTGPRGLEKWLDEAAELLTVQPPPSPELGDGRSMQSSRGQSSRGRAKIEAAFETGLRWQDSLRLRAVELVGELMSAMAAGADPVLTQALAALVLEDLAALGFDPAGAYRSPSFAIAPEDVAAAMAQSEVVYSALAAQLYARCTLAAARVSAPGWQRFCEEGRRGTLVASQALPACTHPSLSSTLGTTPGALATQERAPTQVGLLLQGAFGVPLLDDELDELVATAHRQIQDRVSLPMLPPVVLSEVSSAAGGCVHPRWPSETLVARHPNTHWYGMYLQCEAGGCLVQLCDAELGCQRAEVQGVPSQLASWKSALAALKASADTVLIESARAYAIERPRVAIEAVRSHGGFRAGDPVAEVFAGVGDQLLGCQVDHRYSGQWVLAVDAGGAVTGVRAQDDRYLLPMDQVVASQRPPQACIAERLRQLRFGRAAPGVAARRVTLAVRIPARLQVEVPLIVRHDARVGPLRSPERLGRDGFAVAFARCAAHMQPGPESLGMCVALSPAGGIETLALDPDPAGRERAMERLGAPHSASTDAPAEVRACVAEALAEFEWSCRDDNAGPGHLALTVDLPRRLVARFGPAAGAAGR